MSTSAARPKGRRRPLRVLLVDDSAAVRARLAALLEDCPGVEVAGEASDGPAGVFEARRLEPDAVVLDIRMPGGYGLDALEAFQAWPRPPVVVILTNYPTESYRRWCLARGAAGFLDKSTEFEKVPELLASLGRVSGGGSRRGGGSPRAGAGRTSGPAASWTRPPRG